MASKDAIETKLSAARTRLILDKPFLGALVLRLPMVEADPSWCKTTATDARSFYYNREYIADLSNEQTQFMLAHEALHCALSHFARRQHRIKHRWDLACDFAINPLLIKDGLIPPPDSLYLPTYEGMTAEEIYPLLADNDEQETLDQHVYDRENESGSSDQNMDQPPRDDGKESTDGQGGKGNQQTGNDKTRSKGQGGAGESQTGQQSQGTAQTNQQQQVDEQMQGAAHPPPLTHQEKEALSVQWQQRMAGAAQQALQAGKLEGDMARMVDFLLQPQLPWRSLLSRYMTTVARDDYSFTRPSTRRGDPAIFPSLRSAQLEVVVAVDTSGSIADGEIQEFISEVDAMKGQMRARVTLLACDSRLLGDCPWIYEPWEEFHMPEHIPGGGGTKFTPVFEWSEQQDKKPDLLIYFTDAEGEFPAFEPDYPVIWLVKGKARVPWGQRIQLN